MWNTQALLADLVQRPSINPMGRTDLPAELVLEHRVTDYLEAKLRELGVPYRRMTVAPGRDNLVAEYQPAGTPTSHVIWECHQDTVPVDGMVIEPFAAKVENGKLYGRGACDVKAGGVAMLTAFARLVKEKPAGSTAVTLCFTVDEEHTFIGVRDLMKAGVKADYAIVAEPTLLNIVQAHKGVVRWQIETDGVACHSSRPDQGVNAVYRMARLIPGIEEFAKQLQAQQPDPFVGPPTLSLGMINGGVSPNTVPDRCRVEIDRRLIPGEKPFDAHVALDSFLKNWPGVDFPFRTVPPQLACPPLKSDGNEPLLQRLGQAIDSVVGRHEVIGVPYGTDASTIAEAGIPSVVFGPGDIAKAHTKDEWVELAQIDQAVEILYRFACS